MKEGQRLWTRDELILAINLYCKIDFGKFHSRNPQIIELSNVIDRTPSSVALKLSNFASLDPSLQARGIKGAANSSKLDKEIWKEFNNNWDTLPIEAEKLWASKSNTSLDEENHLRDTNFYGYTKAQIIKARLNQKLFRQRVLAAYNNTCCITGLKFCSLLIASHIRPWGIDESNRLNPCNGIAINALHDKAFENGYITITPNYKIRVSSIVLEQSDNCINEYFKKYQNKSIILPSRFLPDIEFLKYHNNERFIP